MMRDWVGEYKARIAVLKDAENQRLRAALERVTRQCDAWIADCCGAEVGVRFCEAFGCETLVELRALAIAEDITAVGG